MSNLSHSEGPYFFIFLFFFIYPGDLGVSAVSPFPNKPGRESRFGPVHESLNHSTPRPRPTPVFSGVSKSSFRALTCLKKKKKVHCLRVIVYKRCVSGSVQ